ncbi:uncharacterized protein LOC110849914 isoform X2 [Folsomia candida]|nr:uncharacterized protein LOC110849914 isoform X2 [Folsomia candida]XP_021953084.1 uncharacterized protein LOC110849914 isoform X2 [Folsomia candida]XP_035708384.1 uncharacterized protein LOC110849914 isoform X2 [Folsomia candida]
MKSLFFMFCIVLSSTMSEGAVRRVQIFNAQYGGRVLSLANGKAHEGNHLIFWYGRDPWYIFQIEWDFARACGTTIVPIFQENGGCRDRVVTAGINAWNIHSMTNNKVTLPGLAKQLWVFVPVSNNLYMIIDKTSGKCLEHVENRNAAANGANLSNCNKSSVQQLFQIRDI